MKSFDVYSYSTLDHRISNADIESLGPVVPEFYHYLARTFGCGTISHLFDIHRPERLRELTEGILAHADEFDWPFRDTLERAYVIGNDLHGDYWYVPADNELYILSDLEDLTRIGSNIDSVLRHIEDGSNGQRLVFHPFENRQRFRFSHPLHESNALNPRLFDDTVRWFKDARFHDHFEIHGEPASINRDAQLYFPEFGGNLYICQGGGGVSLTLGFDRGVDSDHFQRVLRHADKVGWHPHPHPHDD